MTVRPDQTSTTTPHGELDAALDRALSLRSRAFRAAAAKLCAVARRSVSLRRHALIRPPAATPCAEC